jgi:hypothetical protein
MLFRMFGALVLAAGRAGQALAWGQEGHSIIAELAQHRLRPRAAAKVSRLLGPGHSLASIGSCADDVRDQRPETYNWHFVDIPSELDRRRGASARPKPPSCGKAQRNCSYDHQEVVAGNESPANLQQLSY